MINKIAEMVKIYRGGYRSRIVLNFRIESLGFTWGRA